MSANKLSNNNQASNPVEVNYGVVQSSTLFVFLYIMLNNLDKLHLFGDPFLFADDTAVIFKRDGDRAGRY